MAELQRTNPQLGAQTAVKLNTPNAAAAKLEALRGASGALAMREQGKQAIGKSLFNLANATQNLGWTASNVFADEARREIDLATKMDMQSYTLALGDAQRKAQEEFQANEYATAEEAANAYQKILGQYFSEVDDTFFPANEEDRIPGNYFRYARLLEITPQHPVLTMTKRNAEAAGVNQALGAWSKEQAAVNAASMQRTLDTYVAAGCVNKDIYRNVIKAGIGNQFIDKATLDDMAQQQVVKARAVLTGNATGAVIKSIAPIYEQKLAAALSEGTNFEEAQLATKEELINAANGIIDRDVDSYLETEGINASDRKWAESLRNTAKLDVKNQIRGKESEAKEMRRAALNAYLNAAPEETAKASIYDADLIKACQASNLYEEDKKKYGDREILLDKATGTEVNLGTDEEGNPVDVTEAVADSMIITLSKLTFDTDADYKTAAKILEEARHLEPELHEKIKQVFNDSLDFATNASPERKKEKQSIDITVERFMGEMGINPKYKAIKDMTGDNQKLACALCAAIEGVPVSQRRPVLEAAYHAYKMETWNKLNAWNAWNDFMFTFGDETPQELTWWQRTKNAINTFGKAGGGNEVIKNVSGAGDPLSR